MNIAVHKITSKADCMQALSRAALLEQGCAIHFCLFAASLCKAASISGFEVAGTGLEPIHRHKHLQLTVVDRC